VPSLIDLAAERAKMLKNWRRLAEAVARGAREVLGEGAEAYVFGSAARGKLSGLSDVDVLIVSPSGPMSALEEARAKAEIELRAGLALGNPFEIHIMPREEAEAFLQRAGPAIEIRDA